MSKCGFIFLLQTLKRYFMNLDNGHLAAEYLKFFIFFFRSATFTFFRHFFLTNPKAS